ADLIVHRITKSLLAAGVDGNRELPRNETTKGISTANRRRSRSRSYEQPEIEAPVNEQELSAIAQEVSQCERRAADAERELIEWKKIRFMQDRIGEEFSGIILNVTKYGLFVELDDLFVEGLVPLATLQGDRYRFNENSRQILGGSSGHRISVGDAVRVILDRIDAVENKLQFALVEQVSLGAGKNQSGRKSTGRPSMHPSKKRQKKRSRTKAKKRR
ncbi:MAG TPA: S1 RNA-binding domain-containing protein, partial [Acidobacteriaceae bacterium]|nr:S1 RNA-binding domain-containing protein [Acidobacteriaceae bacterium]